MAGKETRVKLTVVYRDDSPMIHCGDSPSYRSTQIELTSEQTKVLAPRVSYQQGEHTYYEAISRCFIEPEER